MAQACAARDAVRSSPPPPAPGHEAGRRNPDIAAARHLPRPAWTRGFDPRPINLRPINPRTTNRRSVDRRSINLRRPGKGGTRSAGEVRFSGTAR